MYYRICVMDSRTPRDGKTIEEIGTYDPMIRDTDKRVTLDAERVDYWLKVGAKPTENVQRLIEKYKGKVPATRIDEKKVRERVVAPQKGEPRRRKIEVHEEPVTAQADDEPASATEAPPTEPAPETPAAEISAEESTEKSGE